MPATNAIRVNKTGGPEVLEMESLMVPALGQGQVLVRHEAIGLNFIDTYYRSGLYGTTLPTGLGNEAAGVIEAIGEGVGDFREGDRIGYFTGPLGAYADMRVIETSRAVKLPDEVTFEQAAAAMLKGCTAEYLIERCARVQSGQTVLVHAAAGGVGSILVQWLVAIGAQVIAHASDSRKAAFATQLGAHHSLHCPLAELAQNVRDLTGAAGVPVIFDGIGAASWDASLAAVARRGLIVSYGNASGPVPALTPLHLTNAGSIFLTRPTLADYCATTIEMRTSAKRLFDLVLSGKVTINIGARFPLREAAVAHQAIESRATMGSTVLIP